MLTGGLGPDTLLGGVGHDRLSAEGDRSIDALRCGHGRDIVVAELTDEVARDCEVVSRQLSRDPYHNREAQHETEVEPSSFSNGSTIVAAFQAGRFADGGAANIGFSTSRDRGSTWRSGFLPGLSLFSSPIGGFERVSDPVVAYDAGHRVWLVATLGLTANEFALAVSRSRDGVRWAPPAIAGRTTGEGYDKEWLTCDNWRSSPFYGRCYISYLDFETAQIHVRRSTDGGLTWSEPARAPLPTIQVGQRAQPLVANGVQPVARRNGELVIPFTLFDVFGNPDDIGAIRSTDGGETLRDLERIADIAVSGDIASIRADPLPSVAIDAGGTLWVTWSDCRVVEDCDGHGVVISRSSDGRSWSSPRAVRVGLPRRQVEHFLPALAATGVGSRARIAITYYSMRAGSGLIDAWLSLSTDGARTWERPQRLNVRPMRLAWIAEAGFGRFLGDYIATSFVGSKAVPVFSLASEPAGSSLRQAIFATTRVAR